MTRRHSVAGALAGLALTLLAAGCGSSGDSGSNADSSSKSGSESTDTSPSTSAAPDAAAAVITIKDFKFSVPATVKAGATVMVKNEDGEAHTVTADGKGGFDVKIDPGKTAMLTAPSAAGGYPFHCTFHSDMHGTLKVG